jgi:hypothetical protein
LEIGRLLFRLPNGLSRWRCHCGFRSQHCHLGAQQQLKAEIAEFGIKGSRSGDFVIINIESDARRRGEKEAFLARLSDKLAASPGIARDDVFVRLSMTAGLEDWSLGSGIAASKS